MVHFYLTFGRDAVNSPIGRQLSALGLPHRILAARVAHHGRSGLVATLAGRCRILWFAAKAAVSSLVFSRPRPQAIVVWTHLEAFVVATFRALLLRRRATRIVLVGFILTQRNGSLQTRLRDWYFRLLFREVDLAVVHSSVEVARYATLFDRSRVRFAYVPWGSRISGLAAAKAQAGLEDDEPLPAGGADVLSAGRSSRDYPTLCAAFGSGAVQVHIVCDMPSALAGCDVSPNIRILDACHGDDYLVELLQARCVVIPLAADDISAGQMVLLQAMELGKAVVITRTATTVDYATHGHDALLVEAHDPAALRQVVAQLLADGDERARLGSNAQRTFSARFTVQAFITQLVRQIEAMERTSHR